MVSIKEIRQIVKEKKPYLDAMAEFDRTGRLKKVRIKEKATFTIDEELMRKLRKFCGEKGYKMSNFIERLIRENIK